jgi:hypothetical protein
LHRSLGIRASLCATPFFIFRPFHGPEISSRRLSLFLTDRANIP